MCLDATRRGMTSHCIRTQTWRWSGSPSCWSWSQIGESCRSSYQCVRSRHYIIHTRCSLAMVCVSHPLQACIFQPLQACIFQMQRIQLEGNFHEVAVGRNLLWPSGIVKKHMLQFLYTPMSTHQCPHPSDELPRVTHWAIISLDTPPCEHAVQQFGLACSALR